MSTMNDYEEDLYGFPLGNKEKCVRIFGWTISRRVDRCMDPAGSRITSKIPPLFDGLTSSLSTRS